MGEAMTLTVDLGLFIAGLRYDNIPKAAISPIHTAFTDCIGVMIAGVNESAPQLLKTMLAPAGSESTLLFNQGYASAPEAAWINGTAAQVLDFDDVAQRGGHPSAVLVPAILAEAEAVGASGRQMVLAYAAGYETWAELVRRDPDQHHSKGWHPTSIFGPIGAAAACASLRRLDASKAATAIALAASQSGGVVANFGSMTKPFHAGRSAHAGVTSARLADIGFTASLDALENPAGFLNAVSPAGRIDVESALQAGAEWKISGKNRLSIKKYPVCFCAHRALDGVLDLLKASSIDVRNVSRITVSTSRRNATILRHHLPKTVPEATFSMEFAMAAALTAGRVGLAELNEEFVLRPDVQALTKLVEILPDDHENAAQPGYAMFDQVKIHTKDGRVLESGQITKVRGDAELPLTADELWIKFEGCIQVGIPEIPARKLFESLMSLDQLPGARSLPGLGGI